MKRGLTAVVTIILLLLMAVAAVGAAYLWFGRFQTETQAGVTTQMDEGVAGQVGGITIYSAYGSERSASDAGGNPLSNRMDDDYNYWCSLGWVDQNASMNDRGVVACDGTTGTAKISLVLRNTGTVDISASEIAAQNDVDAITILVDGRSVPYHIDNGTMASYATGHFTPAAWRQGQARRIDIDVTCAEIAQKADKRIKIDAIPKQGASSSMELSCRACCAALGANQAACEALC